MWNVYIMEVINLSKKNMGRIEYYTGIAFSKSDSIKDVLRNCIRRWHEHKAHYKSKWMNFTRKVPRRLVYIENGFSNRSVAENRERQIKNRGRCYKEKLIGNFKDSNPVLFNFVVNYFYRYGRFCY